ncbi:helix-turn-helix domain-containing protein [Butyrivibrio sp. WCD2001]|uniref:helix-turn-helix domain-containing protein n=1 Tax=Butyrivibrio sp. WCD2001 TaxID=1280681 RepID=UPI000428B559|nr:helix-turn-helix transcriptional regulator [Butyrivibrio sp. WCD2001]
MNTTIFSERLQECRRRKYSSQQAFADAYMKQFGMIRDIKKTRDHNMFGTVQSWEQGKSAPSADVLANICDLLDCDADYLLGRIDQRTHDITDAHRYTGLSAEALEQLHEYCENLREHPDWEEIRELEENWLSHKYYQSYGLYLIDEILTGSKHHKLNAAVLEHIYTKILCDDGFGVNPEDYVNEDTEPGDMDQYELWAAKDREQIEINTYLITTNIRDILVENASQNKLPPALKIKHEANNVAYSGVDG